MRLITWLAALAAVAMAGAIENKPKQEKKSSKRQVDGIRSVQNLQYELVLPYSRVQSYRALGARSSPRPQLPPYAVPMEPMVQYSQKDPLYDPKDAIDDGTLNKNEIAQSKILNVGELQAEDSHVDQAYGPPYGGLPTAPLYSPHPHYYEQPEPIIEIIIKESNESLPSEQRVSLPQPVKKEPVQVFYVKYTNDPHNENKVIYDKPIPAITPPSNIEEHHKESYQKESYVTVTPEPYLQPAPSTTLRTIIKPESEVYHSNSGIKVTFGNENKHHDEQDNYAGSEGHEETAPRPALAYPQHQPNHQQTPQQKHLLPYAQQKQFNEQIPHMPFSEPFPRQPPFHLKPRPPQFAQSRIQFQQPLLPQEQQLPQQGLPHQPFRTFQSQVSRQGPFGPSNTQGPLFTNGPPNNGPSSMGPPAFNGPLAHSGPFPLRRPPGQPQNIANGPQRPPTHHSRPPTSPPRNFHSSPPSTFHSGPQPNYFFNEPKYLQENYHTITTEQIDPPKDQDQNRTPQNFDFVPKDQAQNRPPQNFDFVPRPTQIQPSPTPISQDEYNKRFYPQFQEQGRPVEFPLTQQLPQQLPPQQFHERSNPSARPPFKFQNFRPHPEQNGPPQFHHQANVPQQHFNQELPFANLNHQFNQHQPPQASNQPQLTPLRHHSSFPGPEQNRFTGSPEVVNHNNNFPSHQHNQELSPRPQFHGSEPTQPHSNAFHQQNVAGLVPNGGELVAAIPKYEQHITVSSTAQPTYNFAHPSAAPTADQQLQQQTQHQFQQQHEQQIQQQSQQQLYEKEQEHVRLQLAQNVQKQQEEIQRLQGQLAQAQRQQEEQQLQKQHQQKGQNNYQQNYNFRYKTDSNQQTREKPYRVQHERSKSQSSFPSSTSLPFYQSTARTVDITPTTQRYISSTLNSINTTPEAKKSEKKKKKPAIELPDEVPDDLRQQLLSSGILDNADISILDYDKIGDTSLDQLPPDQLANFFSAGGAQQIAASDNSPIVVRANGERISRIDELESDDEEPAASEMVASFVAAPTADKKSDVEMKVVHFDPDTMEGQAKAQEYVKEDATTLDAVALNDKKYNRYLPLKVSGNQFPLPDVLKGRKVTSVVVLAPVVTEAIPEHKRPERAADSKLKGIKFVAGDSLQQLLKKPTTENFKRWLDTEKETEAEQQSVILIVTGNDDPSSGEKEIFMYDLETNSVNKLSGELSTAFVEAAENNSFSKDIEKLAITGDGTPESFKQQPVLTVQSKPEDSKEDEEGIMSDGSDNVPLYLDFDSMKLSSDKSQEVSISAGYSKTKKGRSFGRH